MQTLANYFVAHPQIDLMVMIFGILIAVVITIVTFSMAFAYIWHGETIHLVIIPINVVVGLTAVIVTATTYQSLALATIVGVVMWLILLFSRIIIVEGIIQRLRGR